MFASRFIVCNTKLCVVVNFKQKKMSERELINDKRLTPTMERVRSGRSQMFREKNNDEKSRITRDVDVILEHENKEMYAELIDGQWYWVNGCAECNGEARDWMTYIECEKHDRCCVCSTNRKDIKGAARGGKRGWTCNSCHKAKQLEIRREAFKKFGVKEPNCSYTDEIICPHCGSKISNDDMHEDQDIECYVCEGEISLEVGHTAYYSTSIKGKRVTK